MSCPRKHETKAVIAATLILQFCRDGAGQPIVTRKQAATMHPDEIIRQWRSRVIRQHGGAHATGGLDHPANYWFTLREVDAIETPKDISRIAKGKRLQKREAKHAERLAEKYGEVFTGTGKNPKRKGRPMPGSRDSRWRKKLNGRVELRP